jgi:Zn finger protein HypA/HybF involved in hydrogenase expression
VCDNARAMSETIRSVTVTLSVKCEHCSTPVPINGPTQRIHCRSCQHDSTIDDLHEHLALASTRMRQLGSRYDIRYASEAKPKCRQCDQVVDITEQLGQTELRTMIPCSQCGTGLPTYPAPEWLRAQLPAIRQVFGGDPEPGSEAGLALDVESERAPKPIAMTCPQCAGALMITAADERMIECRYCTTSVFLPDELWRRLHPVKTMSAWTVSYAGELQTVQDLAVQEREREREQIEAERARALRVRKQDEAEHAQATKQASEVHVGWVIGMIVVIAVTVVLALVFA